MKFKTTFSLVCLTWMTLLSVGLLNVHANSSCTSAYSTYLAKVDVHNSKREAYHRVQVAVTKKLPPFIAPAELKHLEDEYDSDPNGFYRTVEAMGVGLPGYVSGTHLRYAINGTQSSVIRRENRLLRCRECIQ